MKIVFSVLILLALDLLIFYITHNVTKTLMTFKDMKRFFKTILDTLIKRVSIFV